MEQAEKYSTLPEMAERFKTPPGTWYRWRTLGQGPQALRIGKKLLYPESKVQEWLRSLESDERSQ